MFQGMATHSFGTSQIHSTSTFPNFGTSLVQPSIQQGSTSTFNNVAAFGSPNCGSFCQTPASGAPSGPQTGFGSPFGLTTTSPSFGGMAAHSFGTSQAHSTSTFPNFGTSVVQPPIQQQGSTSMFNNVAAFGSSNTGSFSQTPAFGAPFGSRVGFAESKITGPPFGSTSTCPSFGEMRTHSFGTCQAHSTSTFPTFGSTNSGPFNQAPTLSGQPYFAGFPGSKTSVFGSTTTCPSFRGFREANCCTQPHITTLSPKLGFGITPQPSFGPLSFSFGPQPSFGPPSLSSGVSTTPDFQDSKTPAVGFSPQPSFGPSSFPFGQQPSFGPPSFSSRVTPTPGFGPPSSFGFSPQPPNGPPLLSCGVSKTPNFHDPTTAALGAFPRSSPYFFGSKPPSSIGLATTSSLDFSGFGTPQPLIQPSELKENTTPGFQESKPPPVGAFPPCIGWSPPSSIGLATTSLNSRGFGQTVGDNSQQGGSFMAPYCETRDSDGKLMSVSAIENFGHKSHEELRWEDYMNSKNKGNSSSLPIPESEVLRDCNCKCHQLSATPSKLSTENTRDTNHSTNTFVNFHNYPFTTFSVPAYITFAHPITLSFPSQHFGSHSPLFVPVEIPVVGLHGGPTGGPTSGPNGGNCSNGCNTIPLTGIKDAKDPVLDTNRVSKGQSRSIPEVKVKEGEKSGHIPKGLEIIVEKSGFNPWLLQEVSDGDKVDIEGGGDILYFEEADKDEDIIGLAEFAVEQHNALHKEDQVVFKKVVVACLEPVEGGRYHLVVDAVVADSSKMHYVVVLRKPTDRSNNLIVLEKWLPCNA